MRMKQIVIIALLFITAAACNSGETKSEAPDTDSSTLYYVIDSSLLEEPGKDSQPATKDKTSIKKDTLNRGEVKFKDK
jgi:hypothetical protein